MELDATTEGQLPRGAAREDTFSTVQSARCFACSVAGMDTDRPVIAGVLKLDLKHSYLHEASLT